jgi:hypothetical protein
MMSSRPKADFRVLMVPSTGFRVGSELGVVTRTPKESGS